MKIIPRQMLVDPSKYPIKCPNVITPDRIVVHNTANNAPAGNEISYMRNNNLQVSFHFAVDDKEVVQGLPLDRNGWHAGDGLGPGNMKGIGIEICYSKDDVDIEKFKSAEILASKFIAQLLIERGLGTTSVSKHQDYYPTKNCPHRTIKLGWDRFLNMIRNEIVLQTAPVQVAPPVVQVPAPTGEIVYTVVNGDTLSGIASKYKTTYQKLATYNGISNPSLINIGQKIKIPQAIAAPVATPVVKSTPAVYVPKVGDVVKINTNAVKYVTGQAIPKDIKARPRNTILQVGNGKVLLKEIYSWVYTKDINKI